MGLLTHLNNLLRSQRRQGLEDDSKERGFVTRQMYALLRMYGGAEDSEFVELLQVLSEAQTAGLFSHDHFARYLISTGALISGESSADLKKLLYRLPIHGPVHHHNQRGTLLIQCGYSLYNRVQNWVPTGRRFNNSCRWRRIG